MTILNAIYYINGTIQADYFLTESEESIQGTFT
jgi:hypothetical protein